MTYCRPFYTLYPTVPILDKSYSHYVKLLICHTCNLVHYRSFIRPNFVLQ
nr:MAG TPA: hypothetical protein [Microviridae sp.]